MENQRFTSMAAFTLIIILIFSCKGQGDRSEKVSYTDTPDTIWLFNGKNLDNWEFHHREEVDPEEVWSVRNGIIHCEGEPWGYAKTKEEYSNYILNVEWRWPGNPTNSGVFIHQQGEDKIWPVCYEAQLKYERAGDLIAFPGTDFNERVDKSSVVVPRITEKGSERPPGQWNTYRIIAQADTLELYINGVLENRGTGLTQTSGRISLQSEGSPIEFRNVYLIKQ